MSSASDSRSSPGLASSIGAALRAGLVVGALAGLFDGIVRTLGIDPGLFLIRLWEQGLWTALTIGLPSVGEVPELLLCTAGAICVYVLGSLLVALLAALCLHPLLRAQGEARYARFLGLGLGAWLFLELYWWSRPAIMPDRSATDPARVAAALVLLVVCVAVGLLLPRLRGWLPDRLRRSTPVVALLLAAVGAVYLLIGARGSADLGRASERNREVPNVLLFVVDALRQDVLGCYGHPVVTTPTIDRLAAEGVLFEDAFVQAPFTWTSFGSFLTGKYPRRHGLVKMQAGYTLPVNLTLTEYLHGAPRREGDGLEQEDVVGAAFLTGTLSHGSGLARGFDYYFEALVGHELVDVHSRWSSFRSGLLPWLYKNKLSQKLDSNLVATTAVEWFRANGERRWVAMVHYYSTHTPYDPPDEFRELYCDPDYDGRLRAFKSEYRRALEEGRAELRPEDVTQIQNLYFAGVTQADHMIGQVIEELERQDLLEETIVVVTSDHGESLGEHGLWEHNHMYQDNLRVPLIVRWPRGLPRGQSIDGIVDSIDLMPTLIDLMGLEALTHVSELPGDADREERVHVLDGVSLLPRIRGETDSVRRYSFAENGRYRSIQDERYKLIVRRELLEEGAWEAMLTAEPERWNEPAFQRPRFFDLGADPGEFTNLFTSAYDEHAERIRAYFDQLVSWSETMPVRSDRMMESERDREAQAALMEALGYGGGVGDVEEEEEPDAD